MTQLIQVSKWLVQKINPDRIPRNHDELIRMKNRLEKEEKLYQERVKAIKRIKHLQRLRKERNSKPDPRSIFNRCKVCDEKYLKSEGHQC